MLIRTLWTLSIQTRAKLPEVHHQSVQRAFG